MSARAPLDIETLRAIARLGGFDWSAEVLESLRPEVERMLRAFAALDAVPLGEVEPTTQYRVL
jgi:Asp-tRNA(Asn)/Glu-tRNA(Gln) amidotransferase C subunit